MLESNKCPRRKESRGDSWLTSFPLRVLNFLWTQETELRQKVAILLFSCCHAWHSCEPTDRSPPGSSVHGISQARILEWVAISFSRDLSSLGIKPTSLAWQAVLQGWKDRSWVLGLPGNWGREDPKRRNPQNLCTNTPSVLGWPQYSMCMGHASREPGWKWYLEGQRMELRFQQLPNCINRVCDLSPLKSEVLGKPFGLSTKTSEGWCFRSEVHIPDRGKNGSKPTRTKQRMKLPWDQSLSASNWTAF